MIYYNIYKNPLRCWTIFSPLNCGDGICEIAGATILGAGGRVLQCVAFCVTQEDGIRESQQRNGQLKKKKSWKGRCPLCPLCPLSTQRSDDFSTGGGPIFEGVLFQDGYSS